MPSRRNERVRYEPVRPLGRLPPPARNFAWTSTLIARDVKNFYDKKKTSISNKMSKVFGSFNSTTNVQERSTTLPSSPLESVEPPSKSNVKSTGHITPKNATLKNKKSLHMQKPSQNTTVEIATQQVFTASSDASTTSATDVALHGSVLPPIYLPHIFSISTFYDLMQDKLEHFYKNRPFGLPFDERWKDRGVVIFLYIALELCSSNPVWDKVKTSQWAPDQHTFVLGILQLALTNGDQTIPLALCHDPVPRVSRMPGEIYAGKIGHEVRVDSAFTPVEPSFWPGTRIPLKLHDHDLASSLHTWAALVVALTDRSATAKITETLMQHILPDVDAHEFLIRIGDPSKRLQEGEDDMLREKLRPLLFPDYDQLWQ